MEGTDRRRRLSRRNMSLLIMLAMQQDNYRCQAPGCKVDFTREPDKLSFDHVLCWSRGGATTVYNSGLLCTSCNSSKGDR